MGESNETSKRLWRHCGKILLKIQDNLQIIPLHWVAISTLKKYTATNKYWRYIQKSLVTMFVLIMVFICLIPSLSKILKTAVCTLKLIQIIKTNTAVCTGNKNGSVINGVCRAKSTMIWLWLFIILSVLITAIKYEYTSHKLKFRKVL